MPNAWPTRARGFVSRRMPGSSNALKVMIFKKEQELVEEIEALVKEAFSNREPGHLAILKLRLEKSITQLEALLAEISLRLEER
jgi:hypothetical protein